MFAENPRAPKASANFTQSGWQRFTAMGSMPRSIFVVADFAISAVVDADDWQIEVVFYGRHDFLYGEHEGAVAKETNNWSVGGRYFCADCGG